MTIFSLIKRIKNQRKSKFGDGVTVGAHTYGVGPDTVCLQKDSDHVRIGKYCSIANGVYIMGSGNHNYKGVSTFPFTARILNKGNNKDSYGKGPVVIGNDVWVGHNAIILSGVTIGDGAVVAAGGVVVNNVPPYSIVGGVPAKVIKYRFSEEIINELLAIKWWDWDFSKVLSNIDDFYLDVEKFISIHKDESYKP